MNFSVSYHCFCCYTSNVPNRSILTRSVDQRRESITSLRMFLNFCVFAGRRSFVSDRWILFAFCGAGIGAFHMRHPHALCSASSSGAARHKRESRLDAASAENSRCACVHFWNLRDISFDRLHQCHS